MPMKTAGTVARTQAEGPRPTTVAFKPSPFSRPQTKHAGVQYRCHIAEAGIRPPPRLPFPGGRRARPGVRLGASLAVVAGVVLHRIDSALVAMRHTSGAPYWPSAVELLVTAGIVAGGMLAYDWVARHWPLFETARADRQAMAAAPERPAEARAA